MDLVGQKFGQWTVIRRGPTLSYWRVTWLCRCSCGTERNVVQNSLKAGLSNSCGCTKAEKIGAAARLRIKHGGARWQSATGKRKDSEYHIWLGMRSRCSNPNSTAYADYGGRGIKVCDRWQNDYAAFLADVGKRPSPAYSIDRINNDGNYEPSNVRWATDEQQGRNKRNNRRLTYQGKTLTVSEWAEGLGIRRGLLTGRIKAGWTDEEILTRPIDRVNLLNVKCVVCQITFRRSDIEEKIRLKANRCGPYCSSLCAQRHRLFKPSLRINLFGKTGNLKCINCKRRFDRPTYLENARLRQGRAGPFCSRSCSVSVTSSREFRPLKQKAKLRINLLGAA